MRIWSRSLTASMKRRLCRHEAKRTLTSSWAEGSLHRTKFCFIFHAPQVRFIATKNEKAVQWTAFVFGCGGGIWTSRPPGYEPDELPGCSTPRYSLIPWCRWPGSNRYDTFVSRDFKSRASACSATPAGNTKRPLRPFGSHCLLYHIPFALSTLFWKIFFLFWFFVWHFSTFDVFAIKKATDEDLSSVTFPTLFYQNATFCATL